MTATDHAFESACRSHLRRATDRRIPSGVTGVLNSEFERFMGVTMSTIRKEAARVKELIIF